MGRTCSMYASYFSREQRGDYRFVFRYWRSWLFLYLILLLCVQHDTIFMTLDVTLENRKGMLHIDANERLDLPSTDRTCPKGTTARSARHEMTAWHACQSFLLHGTDNTRMRGKYRWLCWRLLRGGRSRNCDRRCLKLNWLNIIIFQWIRGRFTGLFSFSDQSHPHAGHDDILFLSLNEINLLL